MPSVCSIGFASVTHKQNCVVCGKEFTPKRSDALTDSARCRQQQSRANRKNDPAVLAAKQHVKELKDKRKHDPSNPVSLVCRLNEYDRLRRRDKTNGEFCDAGSLADNGYSTDKTCAASVSGKLRKPKASDVPLCEFEEDEALRQELRREELLKKMKKTAGSVLNLLPKKRKGVAERRNLVPSVSTKGDVIFVSAAPLVPLTSDLHLPPLPKKFTAGIVAHEVECADDCDGNRCNCGCHKFRKRVVDRKTR